MPRGLPNALNMLVGLGLAASILQSATVSAQTIGEVSFSQDESPVSTTAPLATHSNRYSLRNHFFVEFAPGTRQVMAMCM